MNSIVVLKFGGSSVADNLKLNIVAKKIIEFYENNKKVVVVVSAQGKTTDKLVQEAKELSNLPNDVFILRYTLCRRIFQQAGASLRCMK